MSMETCGQLRRRQCRPSRVHLSDSPRRWLVMWSRLAQLTSQPVHLHVRQRLLVLLRPTWSSQRWR
jgi:hypothetical protein